MLIFLFHKFQQFFSVLKISIHDLDSPFVYETYSENELQMNQHYIFASEGFWQIFSLDRIRKLIIRFYDRVSSLSFFLTESFHKGNIDVSSARQRVMWATTPGVS